MKTNAQIYMIDIINNGGFAYDYFYNAFKIDHLKFDGVPKNKWLKVHELL